MAKFFAVYWTLFLLVAGCRTITGFPHPDISGTKLNSTSPPLQPDVSTPKTLQNDDSDMYLEPEESPDQISRSTRTEQKTLTPSEPDGGGQTFYPSYFYNNQPLGHSRPVFFQQEAAYSQRPSGAFRQQLNNYDNVKYNNPFRRENYQVAESSQNLLGSGNFGVIRGGTFYNENDSNDISEQQYGRYNNYNQFFHNNGHGRPAFFFGATNPRPQQHEQFANFRDFADINTPNPAYSEYVVVYINKNGSNIDTEPKKIVEPKNIIERLEMLDREKSKDSSSEKKLSAAKRKLALLPPEKKGRNKKTTTTSSPDLYEPLLALS